MIGALALAHRPLAAGFTDPAVPSAFVTLAQGADGEGQYLVEIAAYQGGEIRTGARPGLAAVALGSRPLAAAAPSGAASSGEVTLRYGDRHWVGEPDDADMPNVFYEGRVTVPLVMERNLPLLPEDSPRVQRQFGSIDIINNDGALDDPSRYAVDGRRVRVLFGPVGADYRDFGVIADVLGTGWQTAEDKASLLLRDQTYSLDLPLQSELYAGTGGAEGGAEIAGKPKPIALGLCRNVSPVLVDPVNLVYQAHYRTVSAVDAVYDRGAALTFAADCASYAALVAATVTAGHYATCLAAGLIRLGSSPDGLITADVHGDADPDYAGTLDLIALRVLRGIAGLADRAVNAGAIASAATLGGEMGLYIGPDETPSGADILDRLFAAAAAWWAPGRDGRIGAGRLVPPETRVPTFYLDPYNVLTVEPEAPPVPRWRQRVAYQPNWTPQETDLAASVTAARRQFLAGPQRVVTWVDTTIRVRHPQALDAGPLASLYDGADDAQAVADSLGALHGPDRQVWRVTLKRFGYLLDLGQVGRLTWPRLGLASGRNVAVVGIREDADQETTTLRVFG